MRYTCFLTVLLAILLVASCTVTTSVTIENDASGRAVVVIDLHPVAVRYMSDITAGFGEADPGAPGPFDIEAIRYSFLAREGIELESIDTEGADTLRLSVRFDDVAKLLGPAGDPGQPGGTVRRPGVSPLSFAVKDGNRKLSLQLTRVNFHRISGLFIQPENPATVLLPFAETDFMPRQEYLEVLTYALEDYLGEISVQEFVKGAGVYATVTADEPISSAEGGEITGGVAAFFIPLVEALTLENDIEYSVTW